MGRQFRPFQNDRGIHIPDPITPCGGERPHPFQQDQAGDVPVGGIRVRELPADVTQTRGAQDRVADGMDQDIGIRMALKPLFVRDFHPAQNQPSSGRKTVAVVAETDSHRVLPETILSPRARSSGVVTLILSASPGIIRTGIPVGSTRRRRRYR